MRRTSDVDTLITDMDFYSLSLILYMISSKGSIVSDALEPPTQHNSDRDVLRGN